MALGAAFRVGLRLAEERVRRSTRPPVQLDLIKVLSQQALTVGGPGRTDFDLFRESAAAQNRWINLVEMIRGSNEEDVVLRKQMADLGTALLNELSIMRAQHAVISGQQPIDFI